MTAEQKISSVLVVIKDASRLTPNSLHVIIPEERFKTEGLNMQELEDILLLLDADKKCLKILKWPGEWPEKIKAGLKKSPNSLLVNLAKGADRNNNFEFKLLPLFDGVYTSYSRKGIDSDTIPIRLSLEDRRLKIYYSGFKLVGKTKFNPNSTLLRSVRALSNKPQRTLTREVISVPKSRRFSDLVQEMGIKGPLHAALIDSSTAEFIKLRHPAFITKGQWDEIIDSCKDHFDIQLLKSDK